MANRALNLPNMLTYGRIIAVPLVVLCFFVDGRLHSSDFARWSALAIFVIASVTDYFDGYLARAWQQQSNIGRMLDPCQLDAPVRIEPCEFTTNMPVLPAVEP